MDKTINATKLKHVHNLVYIAILSDTIYFIMYEIQILWLCR